MPRPAISGKAFGEFAGESGAVTGETMLTKLDYFETPTIRVYRLEQTSDDIYDIYEKGKPRMTVGEDIAIEFVMNILGLGKK